jgi:hypothetical protein
MGPIETKLSKLIPACEGSEWMVTRRDSQAQRVRSQAVGNASMLVVDWDNPKLDDQRLHQRVCWELVPEIYRCLHLLWTLSDGKLSSFHSTLLRAILLELLPGKKLSQKSEEAVQR